MNLREWPLALFTVFGQTAAGAAVFLLLPLALGFSGHVSAEEKAFRLGAAAGIILLIALAAGFAFFHLGRPVRAPKALRNFSGSWLSRELILLLLFGLAAAGSAYAEWKDLGAASRLEVLTAATNLHSSGRSGLEFGTDDGRLFFHSVHPGLDDLGLLRLGDPESFDRRPSGSRRAPPNRRPCLPCRGRPGDLSRCSALRPLGAQGRAPRLPDRSFLAGRFSPPEEYKLVRMILLSAAAFLWLAAIAWPPAFPFLGGAALLAALASEIVGRLQFYALPLGL
jgi:hypothetical protein